MPSATDTHGTFATMVRAERKAQGLTQDQLAKQAGIPTSTLTSIELGRRHVRIDETVALAKALGMPVNQLLGLDGGPVMDSS